MKDSLERDEEICRLYLSGMKKMPQIGREFNLSRQRIQQILKENGITVRNKTRKRHLLLISQIKELIRQEPAISRKQIADRLDSTLNLVSYLITRYKISRDTALVMSRLTSERRRNGRMALTYELLYQKYVVEGKSQSEIGRELGYTQAAIHDSLRRLGIPLRKSKENSKLGAMEKQMRI